MAVEGLKKLDDYRFLIPREKGMRAEGLIYASEKLAAAAVRDNSHQQVRNVAHLPGIVGRSMAMPDIHWGYGFPIGGVAAMDAESGVISPGGVGYDINCGVRLASTALEAHAVSGRIEDLAGALFSEIPSGVGSKGRLRLSRKQERAVLTRGAAWAVENGYGESEDIERTENRGCMTEADPDRLSERAMERGFDQVGTLGSGNHFLEIGVVEQVFDPERAEAFGLWEGQITVMIHSGSRGLGYQVCDDNLRAMGQAVSRYGISLPDRQLACAPFRSEEGRAYFGAMAAAANYAWANRQAMMHWTRQTFYRVLGLSPRELRMRLVYDVCHNIAKVEKHRVEGRTRSLVVHRKGATRAFGPGHPDLPEAYRATGQPVLIPGDMGRYSYVLAGTERAMEETFGSTCHGAGRVLSRKAATKAGKGRRIDQELRSRGIVVVSRGKRTLYEEMSEAYKDVAEVVDVVHNAGLSVRVAKLRPLAVVKG